MKEVLWVILFNETACRRLSLSGLRYIGATCRIMRLPQGVLLYDFILFTLFTTGALKGDQKPKHNHRSDTDIPLGRLFLDEVTVRSGDSDLFYIELTGMWLIRKKDRTHPAWSSHTHHYSS